jgi:hypothetical protein
MLSYKKYITKCVFGAEIVYMICLVGGLLPFRSMRGIELHHALFETLPGFTWLTGPSILWGAVLVGVFSVIFGMYMVWMHNSSIENK